MVSWLRSTVLACAGTALLACAGSAAAQPRPPAPQEQEEGPGPEAAPVADGAPRPAGRRIAVLVMAASGVEAETADALTELAISAVASRGGLSIVGKEEFQAQLGQGEARSIECVSSTACLGRVGVELGVDELVAGTVSRRGERWIFNVNRIDIRTGELGGRAFREVSGDLGDLADALEAAIATLWETPRRPATLLLSANVSGAEVSVDGMVVGVYRDDQPIRLEDLPAGEHQVSVSAPGRVPWSRTVRVAEGATLQLEATLAEPPRPREAHISPLVWVGTAAAAVGVGAGVFFGLSSQRAPEPGTNRADALDFVDSRQTEATIANIAFGVAAAGAVTAVVGLLLSDFGGTEAPPRARVGVAPVAGGALLGVGGSF